MTVAERAPAEVLDVPTLDDLVARANAEHAEVLASIRTAVIHAINAGEALLAAREMVEAGQWSWWVTEHFEGSQASAQQYMRLAFYKDHILSADRSMPLKRAYTYLRGLPAIDGLNRRGRRPLPPAEHVAEARRLRQSGMTYTEIGEVFGVSYNTIRVWLDPKRRKQANDAKKRHYARQRKAQLALRQKEREKAAKRAGGMISEAYSLLRKTSQALEQAGKEAATRDDRAAILDALQATHAAEDHLVRALGIQHGLGRAQTSQAAQKAAA